MLKELLNAYVPLLSGLLFSYLYKPRQEEVALFARIVLYVFLTPLLFTSTYIRLSETQDFSVINLSILSSILVLISFTLARRLFGQGELVLTTMYANAGYIPLGIARSLWGITGVTSVGFYVLGNNFTSNILATLYLSKRRDKNPVERLLKFPLLHAILLALIFVVFKLQIPGIILEPVSTLGNAALTVALVQLGVEAGSHLNFSPAYALKTYGVRLATAIPVTWLFILLELITGVDSRVAIIETVMPSAVSCVVIARELGLDATTTAGIVFVTTLISTFVFLPIVLLLI